MGRDALRSGDVSCLLVVFCSDSSMDVVSDTCLTLLPDARSLCSLLNSMGSMPRDHQHGLLCLIIKVLGRLYMYLLVKGWAPRNIYIHSALHTILRIISVDSSRSGRYT